jgi:hypothetical protein
MRNARTRVALVTAVALVGLLSALAWAEHADYQDGNDTASVLDVHVVKFNQPKGEAPAWTVITFAKWKVGQIWDRGYVYLEIDTEGRERADYYALIRSKGTGLAAQLFKVATKRGGTDRAMGHVVVWRKTNNGVSVRIPLKRLRFGPYRRYYRWWVETSFTSGKCPYTCIDRVPNDGSVQQWRPGMSPSPSASASP